MHNDHPEVYTVQIHALRDTDDSAFVTLLQSRVASLTAFGARKVGLWSALPEQGNYPTLVEVWEYSNIVSLRSMMACRERSSNAVGRALRDSRRALDRSTTSSSGWICARSQESPPAASLPSAAAPIVLFEHMFIESGRQHEYTRLLERFLKPRFFEPTGRRLIGMYRPLTGDATSCFNIWSQADSWEEYAKVGKMDALSEAVTVDLNVWEDLGRFIRKDWRQYLVVPCV